jgi:hypothetical protein
LKVTYSIAAVAMMPSKKIAGVNSLAAAQMFLMKVAGVTQLLAPAKIVEETKQEDR